MTDEKNPFDGPNREPGDDDGDGGRSKWSFSDSDIKSRRIPAGNYRFRCLEVTDKPSQSGNEMLTLVMVVVRGDHQGTELKVYLLRNLSSLWKLKASIMALGVLPDRDGNFNWQPDDLLDRECIGVVADDTFDGQEKSTLKRLEKLEGEPAGGRRFATGPDKATEGFDATAEPEEDRPQHAPPPEDDIPF